MMFEMFLIVLYGFMALFSLMLEMEMNAMVFVIFILMVIGAMLVKIEKKMK